MTFFGLKGFMIDPRFDFQKFFDNIILEHFLFFIYQIFGTSWRPKNPSSKMMNRRTIFTTEVRDNKKILYTQCGVRF